MLKRKRPADREVGPKHAEPPEYASFKPYTSPNLQRAGYKARKLLDFTAKAFHSLEDANLSDRQRSLRAMFVKMFNNREHEYGKAVSNEQLDIYEKDMGRFMHCLGGFFFFGCLERHIELETGMDIVSAKDLHTDQTWESRTDPVEEDGEHSIQIWLNLGRKNQLHDLETLIGHLIHEMVHAWYFYFSCNCESCDRDRLNTTGHPSDHHGPLFLMLHRLIVTEIRRWDPALDNFLTYDCPKDDISQSAKKLFHSFMAELPFDERRKYNRVRSLKFGIRNYIKLTDDDKVIVRPVLKINQVKREDVLRRQILREKGRVEDMSQHEDIEDEEGSQGNKGSVRSKVGSETKE